MKKKIIFLCMFIWSVYMYGVGIMNSYFQNFFKNDETLIQEKAEEIMKCIQEHNSKKLVSMFCPKIVGKTPNLENDIKILGSKIDGKIYQISEVRSFEKATFGDGKGIVQRNAHCKIKINDINYVMRFIYIKKNYSDRYDIGLYSLEILEMEKVKRNPSYFNEMTQGIYDSTKTRLTT